MTMSGSSTLSGCSLCSQGPIVNPIYIGDTQNTKSCKRAANWTEEETMVLFKFLVIELPRASDGGNFKRVTWTVAASHLVVDFTVIKGGVKDSDTYEHKFQLASPPYRSI